MTTPSRNTLTTSQLAAVAKLGCGCERPGGLALLCGPRGVGKTTVLARLAADIGGGRSVTVAPASQWTAAASLPDVVLADVAHESDEATLHRLVDRCRERSPAASLVLAGEGRLFTLIMRDARIEPAIRLRVSLPAFTAVESRRLLEETIAGAGGPALTVTEDAARAVHEIAAGIPAAVVRLAELAAVVAAARPDRTVVADDVEAVHGRLSPAAA